MRSLRASGEQEVRAHARVETRFCSRRGITRAPSRLLVSGTGHARAALRSPDHSPLRKECSKSQEACSPVPRHPRSACWRGLRDQRPDAPVRYVLLPPWAVPIVTPMAAAVLDAGVVPAAAGLAFELAEVVWVELALEPHAATRTAVTGPSSTTPNRRREGCVCCELSCNRSRANGALRRRTSLERHPGSLRVTDNPRVLLELTHCGGIPSNLRRVIDDSTPRTRAVS